MRRPRDFVALRHALLLAAGAAAIAILPLGAPGIERVYSTRLYIAGQRLLTAASNGVSFALLDVTLIVAVVWWSAAAARDVRRGGWRRGVGSVAVRTLAWAAAAYIAFVLAWGLNYRRVPLAEKLEIEPATATIDAARRLAETTVGRVNALYVASRSARSEGVIPDAALATGLAAALADLHLPAPVVARPKRTLLNRYMLRAGVGGMTDPFFLETLVADDLLPFERPFVVAHEWSHLAGVADEGDANFVGWLACVRGSAADQYSGWLFLHGEMMRAVGARDRAAVSVALAAGPRDDLRAIRERIARHVSPRLSAAGWRVYDSYLKANRVEAGTASYAGVVKLVLAAKFRADWHPQVKP